LPYTGSVPKNDPFFKSKEFNDFTKDSAGRPATHDMYNSPYFGSVGAGSIGRAQDEAYRKFKNIPDPTPRMISPGPTPPSGGATGSTGFKSGPGNLPFMSNAIRAGGGNPLGKGILSATRSDLSRAAEAGKKAGAAPGNTSALARAASAAGVSKTPYMGGLPQTPEPNSARGMMKKGGEVKASKATKASSASKRGDGIATKGKTKGRMV
jgi:hypothetical protein